MQKLLWVAAFIFLLALPLALAVARGRHVSGFLIERGVNAGKRIPQIAA